LEQAVEVVLHSEHQLAEARAFLHAVPQPR
jgi:hypothetical protein